MNFKKRAYIASLFLNLFIAAFLYGQIRTPEFVKQIRAVRINERINIDGILSESVWNVPGTTEFYQCEPDQGKAATESTEVWVAYDDNALYIAACMKDAYPDSIYSRLSRRDNDVGSDRFAVGIDSYHDQRNGYYFCVSAAGTQMDGILYNDDWNDGTWDGVWESKPLITEQGWTVEMRIPFSQIRFKEKESQVWGINFERDIGRRKEKSYIVYTPRNESGFVSRFPVLVGIEKLPASSRIELRPFLTAKQEFVRHENGDPFNTGSRFTPDIGGDFKLGIGSNMTLDGAVNPDFGQVEVDPAVVNLSDVETYYDEKRPFFIEGMNIFSFGFGGVNSFWTFNWSHPSLFYSRRIGRPPQRELPDHDFAEVPGGTRILGAAKLTGKLFENWNVGLIQAVTNREYARIDSAGVRRNWEVEPLTSYTVVRIQHDMNEGRQGIGILADVTHRFFKDESMRSELSSDAVLGGVDGWTAFDKDKVYMISGWTAFSRISGSKERILNLQQGWPHYYERPDAKSYSIDSNATRLEGFAGRITFNKQKGRMMLNSAFGFVSPGFEPGDLGYLSKTNVMNYHIASGYKWNDPNEYYRYLEVYGSYFQTLDFDGNTLWRGLWGRVNYQFPNYHSVGLYYDYGFKSLNNQRTRGGPLTLNLPAYEWGLEYYTDNREKYIGEFYFYMYKSTADASTYNINSYLTMRPVSNLSITMGPGYSIVYNSAQWVDSYDDTTSHYTFGRRYIFADINYREFSAQLRVNWTFSPTLSLQLYLQPLFATGKYSRLKELARPRSFDFNVFGEGASTISDSLEDGGHYYYIDPDGSGPAVSTRIEDPNFNRVELRANAVLRWEYLPGSTIYFVWTQSRYESIADGKFNMGNSLDRLAGIRPDNIFMLKLTYWIGM